MLNLGINSNVVEYDVIIEFFYGAMYNKPKKSIGKYFIFLYSNSTNHSHGIN